MRSSSTRRSPQVPGGCSTHRLQGGRLSARGLDRVRRVALTLADLEGSTYRSAPTSWRSALQLRSEPLAEQAVA